MAAKKKYDIDDMAAMLDDLDKDELLGRIAEVQKKALPLREKREKLSLQIIKDQEERDKLTAEINEIERPLRNYKKLVTIGIRSGKIAGQTTAVGSRTEQPG
jgi:hypothetical protein